MHGNRIICLGVVSLALAAIVGCDNPESREAGEKIGDATVATGRALERGVKEGVQGTGQVLEGAGERMQTTVDPGDGSTSTSTSSSDGTLEPDSAEPPDQVIVREPQG